MYLFVFISELEGIVIFFKIWELVIFVCNDMQDGFYKNIYESYENVKQLIVKKKCNNNVKYYICICK